MKLSQLAINAVSTRHAHLEEAFVAYQAAGFRQVELVIPQVKDYLKAGHRPADVRRLLDRHGLRCIGGFETHARAFAPRDECARNHELLAANARLLADLGATTMVVGTDGPQPGARRVADPLAVIVPALAHVARLAKPTGVTLCLEFNWSPVVKSFRTAAAIARRSRAANLGVLFDPAHFHCTPTKFDQLNAENIAWVRHVHLDDMRDKPGELSDCNADRVLPGQGILDLRGMIAALEKHGYRGNYSIELFNAELWRLPAAKAAKLMYRSLLPYCRR